MKTLKTLGIVSTLLLSLGAAAQEPATTATTETAATGTNTANFDKPVWTIGISGTVVDDDGEPFNNLFNVGDSWNFLPYPTRLHVDMQINPRWSFEAAVTYNMLQKGKMLNNEELVEDYTFFAFDVNAKFHFIKAPKVFDPYGVGGLGYTHRAALENQTPTLNVGVGANIWFIPSFGLNLQTTGKVKMIGTSSNYMLHSLGLVYRFGQ